MFTFCRSSVADLCPLWLVADQWCSSWGSVSFVFAWTARLLIFLFGTLSRRPQDWRISLLRAESVLYSIRIMPQLDSHFFTLGFWVTPRYIACAVVASGPCYSQTIFADKITMWEAPSRGWPLLLLMALYPDSGMMMCFVLLLQHQGFYLE